MFPPFTAKHNLNLTVTQTSNSTLFFNNGMAGIINKIMKQNTKTNLKITRLDTSISLN